MFVFNIKRVYFRTELVFEKQRFYLKLINISMREPKQFHVVNGCGGQSCDINEEAF